MAFDHPVEADRVDLNFTSIIARAPVIGSLMYLLGGHQAREEEEYARKEVVDFALASESQNSLSSSQPRIKSALKKSSPSLAPTDEGSDNESFQSALDDYDRHNENFDSEPTLGRKKKELSWSDESGQNLVHYIDALPISAAKEGSILERGSDGVVGMGGMTRTRSIRHQLEENQIHASRDKSYLPRMTPHGGGVVMPTMHNNPHPSAANGGIESPQWGWYMNLTPPSPEMYTAYSYPKKSTSASTTSSDGSKPKRPSCTKPNPIFQSLPSQRKDRATHPTMPL